MRRTRLEPYLGAGPVPNGLQVSVEVWERWEGDLRGGRAGDPPLRRLRAGVELWGSRGIEVLGTRLVITRRNRPASHRPNK